ncbi:hypothetical protein [Oceanicola sp. 502str15]|uniref:hypothetical protein n=1 Tax=Oceanicola sp. 502str15 TaxID=2696061 RepID=UPI0020959343|nr:hypothetical protein [Oceanicola sp. 502str15]MCO6382760.1 hypothetical protein [Oceanicola sp. 502str15]
MIRALALACLLLPGAAAGAQSYDTMDRAQCESLLTRVDMLGLGAPIEAGTARVEEGACLFEQVVISGPDAYVDYGLDRARVRIGGAARLEHGLPPEALEIEVAGAHLVYRTGVDPAVDWLMGEQMRADGGIALVLRAHWERDSKRLVIEDASADFPWDNSLRMSAVVEGLDLTDAMAMQLSAMQTGLARAEVEMVSHGLFEQIFMLPLGTALLSGGGDVPTEQRVEAMRAQALEALATVPEMVMNAEARQAAAALLADLPHPVGRVRVELRAEPVLGALRMAPAVMTGRVPETVEDIWPMLEGVTLGVVYAPDE